MSEDETKIKELEDAFKKVQSILSPYWQDSELLEFEDALLKNHQKLLMLRKQMRKVNEDIQKDSFKLQVAQRKYMEHLKDK